jgi:hypothetical protein
VGARVLIPAAHAGNATLELQTGSEVAARKITLPAAAPGNALPLRLDRLNHTLLERLRRREEASRPGGSADVAAYLRQHDIVYRHPAPGWGKACPSATAMSAFW